MGGASMPKTAVYEYGNATADPSDVGAPTDARQGQATVHAVAPNPGIPQRLAKPKLGARVSPRRHALHALARLLRGSEGLVRHARQGT